MSEPRAHIHSSFAHHNGHNSRLMHNPVCHCNHLFLDYNSRPSKLVCTSVTLASFIQLRDIVCVGQGFPNTFLDPPQHCTFCMSPLSDTPISGLGVATNELMS